MVLFKAKLRYLSGGAGCLIMCLWLERKWGGACERVQGLEAACDGPGGAVARVFGENMFGEGICSG